MVFSRTYKVGENSFNHKQGFYRYSWTLDGSVAEKCEWSKDRLEWLVCNKFKSLSDFDEELASLNEMKYEREEYLETITYKNYCIPVFNDDYGQSVYVILDGKQIDLGTYNFEYEEDVKYLVDEHIKNKEKEDRQCCN